jgi:hypothetical protein
MVGDEMLIHSGVAGSTTGTCNENATGKKEMGAETVKGCTTCLFLPQRRASNTKRIKVILL